MPKTFFLLTYLLLYIIIIAKSPYKIEYLFDTILKDNIQKNNILWKNIKILVVYENKI